VDLLEEVNGFFGQGVGVCGEKFLVRNGTIAICSVPTHPLL